MSWTRRCTIRQTELEPSYGLDQPWYGRMPGMVARVLTFDLGTARTLRCTEGSNRVVDIVLERLPNTMLLLTTSLLHHRGVRRWRWACGWRRAWARGWTASCPGCPRSPMRCPAGGRASCSSSCSDSRCACCRRAACSARHRPRTRWAASADLLYHAILPILTLVMVSLGPCGLRGPHDDHDRRPGRPRDARPRQGHGRADRAPAGTSCGWRRRPSSRA